MFKLNYFLLKKNLSGSEWLAIQSYQSIINEEKQRKEQETEKMKKSSFKKSLDEQLQYGKKIRSSHLHDDDQYIKFINDDVKTWEIEEKLKREKIQQKYHEELAIQKKQILDKKQVFILIFSFF
jgi:hypothetical protein